MIRVTVLYPASEKNFDYDYYVNKHTPMVLDLWQPHGLSKIEINKGLAGIPNFTDVLPKVQVNEVLI